MFEMALSIGAFVLGGWALSRFVNPVRQELTATEIEDRWRVLWFIVATSAVLCGLMFLIVIAVSAYVSAHPEIPIFVRGKPPITENKGSYFGWLSFIHFWLLLGPAYMVLRWKHIRGRAEAARRTFPGDMRRLLLVVMILWTASGAFTLYRDLFYYGLCLHGDCSIQ